MKNHAIIRSATLRASLIALFVAVGWHVAAARARADSGAQDFDQQMQAILQRYLRIGNALSTDSMDGVRANAEDIAKLAAALDSASVSGDHAVHYKNIPADLEKAAKAIGKAQGLEKARESFKKLSQPMAMWVGMSKPTGVDVVYCSMVKGSWVQKRGKIRNPYYGARMLGCGEIVGSHSDEGQGQHGGHGH